MAEINGKSTLKANEVNESYALVTNEPVKGGITWTVSLKPGSYKVVKNNHGRTISISFGKKNNQHDLKLIVRAEYRLMDGQERMVEKEVVLQGTNNSRETQTGNELIPDTGNKSAVVLTADTGKQEENKKTGITFKIHVYFDGTFGNKTNIRVMEKAIPDLCKEAFSESLFKGDKNISLAEKYLIKNKWYPPVSSTVLTELMEVPIYISSGPLQGETKAWQDVPVGKQYDLKRDVIAGYSRIPLAIMLHFTKKLGGIKLKGKEGADSTKVHEELVPVKESLLNYAINNHKHGRDINPVTLFNSRFNHLRTKYLHLSAVLDLIKDISEDKSNISEVKDVARLNLDGFPNRAVFSDLNDWDELMEMGKKIWKKIAK